MTNDIFETALFTASEAARIIGVPQRTFANWVQGSDALKSPSIVSTIDSSTRTAPSIPFVGLAEGYVLSAIRSSGVPMQRIRPALIEIEREFGLCHALASKRLYTDGAEVLYDFAESHSGTPEADAALELIVARNRQRVFTEVVAAYLRRVDYRDDGFVRRIALPGYRNNSVVVDPELSFGQPTFIRSGARVVDVLHRFQAGEGIAELADDYDLPSEDIEDAVRVLSQTAA